MTIEAGALSLRISETGADAVLAKLNQIDQKARALGTATQGLTFNAASATGINGQLGMMSANFTRVGQAAAAATPAIQQNTAAQNQQQVAIANLGKSLASQYLGYQGLRMVLREAGELYDFVTAASDRNEIAQRKLSAVARLTGTSFETIAGFSRQAQTEFVVSGAVAADLTQQFVKLASRSGNVAATGSLMTSWMDLAAANGLTLDQALQALTTTLGGNDEGLNKIGLGNPSQIWQKWADAAGMTVGKMTEQQKWLAIVNEVTTQAALVQGEYHKSLDTTLGKQQEFNTKLEAAAAIWGKSLEGPRTWAYAVGAAFASAYVSLDAWSRSLGDKVQNWLRQYPMLAKLARMTGDLPPEAAKDHVVGAVEFQQTTGLMKPPPKVAPLTSAERAAAKEAAEAAREARLQALGGRAAVTGGIMSEDYKTQIAQLHMDPTVGVDSKGKMKGVKAFGIGDVIDKEFDAIAAKIKEKQAFINGIIKDSASFVGNAFGDAFTAAFEGGNFFAALGKSLLSSIGGMVMQLGEAMLTYGTLMAIGAPLLMASPFAGQALSAPAAIAGGIGLIALGAGMGAIGGKGKGGHGGGGSSGGGTARASEPNQFEVAFDPDHKLRKRSGPAVIPSARGMDNTAMPDARQTFVYAPTIIGKDDQKAQKDIAYMVEKVIKNGGARGIRGNG